MSPSESKKKTVLALMFDCNPKWPSLPIVAFKYALALGQHVDLTVVTDIENKANIEAAAPSNVKFEYINNNIITVPILRFSKWLRGGHTLGWTTHVIAIYPIYLAFELACWWRFRRQLRQRDIDLIHRATPMSPTLPSIMPRLTTVPFVLGPINGGLDWPAPFRDIEKREKEWLRPLRSLYKRMPFSKSMFKRTSVILASFPHTIDDLHDVVDPDRVIDFPEVGVDEALFRDVSEVREASGPLTIGFFGRLVPYKLPDIVALAFAESPILRQHRLVFVGDGPERAKIEAIVHDNGLEACTRFTGWVQQEDVAQWMRKADIMAFPSIRELGAGVVVEAMACGAVPVVCNHGAPGRLVGTDRGIAVPVVDRTQLVAAFRSALESLVLDRKKLREFGMRAREFALRRFSWERKARLTCEIYEWCLDGRRGKRPTFWCTEEELNAPNVDEGCVGRDAASSETLPPGSVA